VLIVSGVLLIVAAISWQLNALAWTHHAHQRGGELVNQFRHRLHRQAGGPSTSSLARLGSCGRTADGGVQGLLAVPALQITAPVEEGVDDAQLNVAVGHLPTSVEPGTAGTSVLEAHNVSYFVNLPSLKAGDTVRYETPCRTDTFVVQSHAVVAEGSPVYNTSGPTLMLITCWPTNALWFTSQRYLVSTTEVSSAPTGSPLTYEVGASPPSVPAPAALASEGLTLTTNSIPMGTLTLVGSPGPSWAQSTGPLLVEDAAVAGFIAGVKSLTQDQARWWDAVAPGLNRPTPLVGVGVPRYNSPLQVAIAARGSTATSVTLSTTVTVTGGRAPGRYAVSVAEAIHGATLVISSWAMRPA
jgi:LPXTG-site transpeptidase (sortase) family protein